MREDRTSLCVLRLLCVGHIEIPRTHVLACQDTRCALKLNIRLPAALHGNRFGPEKDAVWTGFFVVPLLGICRNSINCNHLHATPPRGEKFSAYRSLKTRNGSALSTSHRHKAMLQMLRNVTLSKA